MMKRLAAFLALVLAVFNVGAWAFVLKFGLHWVKKTQEAMRLVDDAFSIAFFLVLPVVAILLSIGVPSLYIRAKRPGAALISGAVFAVLFLIFCGWAVTGTAFTAPPTAPAVTQ